MCKEFRCYSMANMNPWKILAQRSGTDKFEIREKTMAIAQVENSKYKPSAVAE
jgi:hypothetical protein